MPGKPVCVWVCMGGGTHCLVLSVERELEGHEVTVRLERASSDLSAPQFSHS